MESRVSQQSNSLDTTRTSQLITMVNELLMPLAMNHSNSSGTFEEYTANKRYTRNNITSRAYAIKTGILADRFFFRKLTKDKASGGKSSGGSSGGNKKSGGGNKVICSQF